MKKANTNRNFLILLTGLLSCLMVSMLYLGGGINLKCFLGTEKIYDFSKEDLTKNANGFAYHQDAEGYSIVKNNAINKYRVGRGTGKWKCLSVTIDKLNVPVLYVTLEYYDKEKELLAEQPAELVLGENNIFLNEELPFYRLGIRIRDAEGTFFSIQSMQTRSEVSGFTPKRFVKVMGTSTAAFLLLFAVWILWQRKRGVRFTAAMPQGAAGHILGENPGGNSKNSVLISALQSLFCIPGDFFGVRVKSRTTPKQRERLFTSMFFLLFFWIQICNLTGFGRGETYRYFMLVCVGLLAGAALLLWENPLREVSWRNPLALYWCGLWCMVIISDIFVDAGNKFIGYVMLFVAGFFIFSWNQTENPQRVLTLMMRALEADFVLTIILCVLFRQIKPFVYYNGIFQRPDEMAMYAALLSAVFLAELLEQFWKGGECRKIFLFGSGTAVSLYLTLVSGAVTAYVALGCVVAVMGVKLVHLSYLNTSIMKHFCS